MSFVKSTTADECVEMETFVRDKGCKIDSMLDGPEGFENSITPDDLFDWIMRPSRQGESQQMKSDAKKNATVDVISKVVSYEDPSIVSDKLEVVDGSIVFDEGKVDIEAESLPFKVGQQPDWLPLDEAQETDAACDEMHNTHVRASLPMDVDKRIGHDFVKVFIETPSSDAACFTLEEMEMIKCANSNFKITFTGFSGNRFSIESNIDNKTETIVDLFGGDKKKVKLYYLCGIQDRVEMAMVKFRDAFDIKIAYSEHVPNKDYAKLEKDFVAEGDWKTREGRYSKWVFFGDDNWDWQKHRPLVFQGQQNLYTKNMPLSTLSKDFVNP